MSQDVNIGANNAAARHQDVPFYLCPSDPSPGTYVKDGAPEGRSNYFGSLGGNAYCRPSVGGTGGVFYIETNSNVLAQGGRPGAVRILEVTDGTSNTAMFAEVLRGYNNSKLPFMPQDARIMPSGSWVTDGMRVVNGTDTFPACNTSTSGIHYAGLMYFRDFIPTSLYTHTVPPNFKGADCLDGTVRSGEMNGSALWAAHLASRSFHTGGVNVCFADGSVHFIGDTINPAVWYAIGTRANGEVIDASQF